MTGISSTLTVKTAGTGLPPPPPTVSPPPTTAPSVTPTPPPVAVVVQPSIAAAPVVGTRTTKTVTTQPGMKTMLLDTQRWDLVTDAAGNIAIASPPYSMAQDAASAIRLFQGEAWYDTSLGVPYFQQILGKQPPLAVLKNAINSAATSVPNIVSAQTFIQSINHRDVVGQTQLTTTAGTTLVVTGALQASPLKDSAGNPMTDSAGNLIFTVM